MNRINWVLSYEPIPRTPWRWSLVGTYDGTGQLWAHYLFTTKPNRRMQRRTKRGKVAAILWLTGFEEIEAVE